MAGAALWQRRAAGADAVASVESGVAGAPC